MTIDKLILESYAQNKIQGVTITPYGVYMPLRVTGVGYSIRFNNDDQAYISKRDKSYLQLKEGVIGLPIILDHPLDEPTKNNANSRRFLTLQNFKDNPIIGTCLESYESDDELWALAKIYDLEIAIKIANNEKSTSPSVYCVYKQEGNVIVDEPVFFNHLAIVDDGHWDKENKTAVDNSKINILDLKDEAMRKALELNSIDPCLVDDYRYLNKGVPSFFNYNKSDPTPNKDEQDEPVTKQEMQEQEKQKDELLNAQIDNQDKETDMADIKELDSEIKKDKEHKDDKLYEEDDRVKRDAEKDMELRDKATNDESEEGYEKDDDAKAKELDKEIKKDKESDNDDKLYEEDDRVKRDKERDDALRDKENAKNDSNCMRSMADDEIDYDEPYNDDDKLRDEILGVMEELADTLNESLKFKKVVCSKRERPEHLANRLLKANLALCDSAYKPIIQKDKLKEFGRDFTKKVFKDTIDNIKALNDSANKKQGKRHADVNGWVKINENVSIKSLR